MNRINAIRSILYKQGLEQARFSKSLALRRQFFCVPLAPPLGELSPKVTERVLCSFPNSNINLIAYSPKIPIHIPVGESQHFQSKSLQICGAFCIICDSLCLIVLRTIQFNHQLCASTVEIHNKFADDPLFVYFYWVFAQKKIPELAFMRCHIPPQTPGIF